MPKKGAKKVPGPKVLEKRCQALKCCTPAQHFRAWHLFSNLNKITKEIEDDSIDFWVSESENDYLGYFKLDSEVPPVFVPNKKLMHLDRIYFDKNYLSQGIGKHYLEKCFDLASQAAFEGLWLKVWEENLRGIKFYEREGFKKYGQVSFDLEFEGFILPLNFLIYARSDISE